MVVGIGVEPILVTSSTMIVFVVEGISLESGKFRRNRMLHDHFVNLKVRGNLTFCLN